MREKLLILPLYFTMAVFLVPIAILFYLSGLSGIITAFSDKSFIDSLTLTFLAAIAATFVNVLLGTPVAYSLARKLVRWESSAYDLLLSPISIPHTVVGIMLLVTFSPISPIYLLTKYMNPVNTFFGMVLAMFFVSAPIYIMAMKEYFERMDQVHELFTMSLGNDRLKTFTKVVFPMSSGSIMRVSMISLGRALSEFGSLIILSYTVTMAPLFSFVSPATVFIWYKYETYGLLPALRYSSAMLLISMLLTLFLYLASKRAD
ncbi:MAG: ABC transporter permease [Nitrososphaerota archaeon]|jgi:molybdate/tungstate transport system permease protein|nr:ABC transporter permease [Nitrososphaerota archaeon]MDG6928142.1 ABC transporter permease [Nitrososphaerota archaeon]MDG6930981.1 ABC transporter permease [Nitrososphaerota archaeon]MDG6932805.1 ABC transporter permease [Nitrososphaerota archaeon]MDG6935312.1 ABC transporter permease [Nitrososphaerota archaeon]